MLTAAWKVQRLSGRLFFLLIPDTSNILINEDKFKFHGESKSETQTEFVKKFTNEKVHVEYSLDPNKSNIKESTNK